MGECLCMWAGAGVVDICLCVFPLLFFSNPLQNDTKIIPKSIPKPSQKRPQDGLKMVFMLSSAFDVFLSPLGCQLVSNLDSNLGTKIWLFPSKRLLGQLRAGSARVLKKDLKLKGSRDRFLIDFERVLGAAGGAKIMFSLQRGSNFHFFGYLKITCLLDP